MSYLSTAALVQRCILRLRQVSGVSTQLYSEELLANLLEECYEQCRALRWWDHMMTWQTRTLDGVAGKVTVPFIGVRDRMSDVQGVYTQFQGRPLPTVDRNYNPARYNGTTPRAIEALSIAEDALGERLFRVYPLASVGDVQVRVRSDPAGVFTDPAVVVPFDATALVNGACMKYSISDATNPGNVSEFDRAYTERVEKLAQQHDSVPLPLDTRSRWWDSWREEYP